MRTLGKWLGRAFLLLVGLGLALWLLGPYEDDSLAASFDPAEFNGDVQGYFDAREAPFDDITPGVQKQVIWNGQPETRTEWAVLYLHGFSATAQEIRPVPDRVARALGANLVLTRLKGHGRSGDAMADGTVPAWMGDVAEGLAAARAVGDRVLVIGTSTGGTLAAAAAVNDAMAKDVAGVVLISPNFKVKNPMAALLTWPAARYWLPTLAGERREFEPANEGQATYWTTEYPSVATLPMGALVAAVDRLDLATTSLPALFIYADNDQVVDATATDAAMTEWGGPTQRFAPQLSEADDSFAHVIAGDILSPGQNGPVTERIISFAEGL